LLEFVRAVHRNRGAAKVHLRRGIETLGLEHRHCRRRLQKVEQRAAGVRLLGVCVQSGGEQRPVLKFLGNEAGPFDAGDTDDVAAAKAAATNSAVFMAWALNSGG
jgi:hypothetical protein